MRGTTVGKQEGQKSCFHKSRLKKKHTSKNNIKQEHRKRKTTTKGSIEINDSKSKGWFSSWVLHPIFSFLFLVFPVPFFSLVSLLFIFLYCSFSPLYILKILRFFWHIYKKSIKNCFLCLPEYLITSVICG